MTQILRHSTIAKMAIYTVVPSATSDPLKKLGRWLS
jgi:hypothetical protein